MNKQHYVPDMMGCSDGGCIFNYKPPGTMVTNGGCQCSTILQRTEEGRKAIRTIIYLRNELGFAMSVTHKPFAGYPAVPADRQIDNSGHSWVPLSEESAYVPRPIPRTMGNKVQMIKDIRERTGAGLKESKEAMDAVYHDCSSFEQVIESAIDFHYKRKWK